MGRDEGLLQQIQRLIGLADAGAHHPEYRLAMPSHDLGKGGVSPRDAERRQLPVGQCRPVEAHRVSSVSALTTA